MRMRRVPPPCPDPEAAVPSASSGPRLQPRHSPMQRTWCVVELGGHPEDQISAPRWLELFVGEAAGHDRPCRHSLPGPWEPPPMSRRRDVAPWVSEAVLALQVGETADFEAVSEAAAAAGGLPGRCRLRLLETARAADLLGEGGLVLRELDPGFGEKPRELAKVFAEWTIWFALNGEEVMRSGGHRFVLDESKVMVAIECALRDMTEGSRACLRVTEEWGRGPLTPDGIGGPVLQGAALWIELRLHEVENERGPGEHASVGEALEYAGQKKDQGNRLLSSKVAADDSRALRRYQAGMKALAAILTDQAAVKLGCLEPSDKKKKRPDEVVPPMTKLQAGDADLPRIEELLTSLRLNAAQAELRREKWRDAAELCRAVLEYSSAAVHPKAYYRRGCARAQFADYQGAIEDLRAAAAAMPADVSVRRELARVEALYKEHRAKEKESYGGFLNKASQKEKEKEEREEARRKAEAEAEAKLAEEKRVARMEKQKAEAEERARKQLEAQAAAKAQEEKDAPKAAAKAQEKKDASKARSGDESTDEDMPKLQAAEPPGGVAEVGAAALPAAAPTPAPAPPAGAPAPPAAAGAPAGAIAPVAAAAAPRPAAETIKEITGRWSPMQTQDDLNAQANEIALALNAESAANGGPKRNFVPMATVTQVPEPVDYEVPSFLRGKKKRMEGAQSSRTTRRTYPTRSTSWDSCSSGVWATSSSRRGISKSRHWSCYRGVQCSSTAAGPRRPRAVQIISGTPSTGSRCARRRRCAGRRPSCSSSSASRWSSTSGGSCTSRSRVSCTPRSTCS